MADEDYKPIPLFDTIMLLMRAKIESEKES